ncbi:MAG: energy-coupling factor transporter ATPase [Paludibacteraceae bacterium]|nr:energy-coupling factor transporter ATPase [Paludibacteraceae bacterium]
MFNNRKEIIKIKDLTYIYTTVDDEGNEIVVESGAKQANGLQGVSLSVYEGEFLALVGHNGSGKSTLAKTLNALIVPQSGDVEVFGLNTKSHKDVPEIRRNVGMVFQNPDNQMVASIVEDDVAFGPENIGVPQPEIVERVKWALSAVKMQDFAKRTPTKMSGGQKQRIAIAGVLALKPKVIVLDESTAMLDPQGRKEVLDTVKRLNKEENITIILITHFMDEVLGADRVIALDGGKIVMEGTPKQIFAQEQKVREIGLDLPVISDLAHQLNKRGFDLNVDVFEVEKLGDEICQSLSKI